MLFFNFDSIFIFDNIFFTISRFLRNKWVFNYCQTRVLFLYKGATLVEKRANGFYTVAGSPAWRLVLNPLVAYRQPSIYCLLA